MRRLSALAGPAERVEVGAPSSTSASGPKRHSKKKKRKKKPKKLPDWVSLVYRQGCNIEAADTALRTQNSNVSDLSAHRITEEEHTRRHDLLVSKHAKEAKEEVEERSRRLSANPRESLEALQALRPEQDPCAAALRVK